MPRPLREQFPGAFYHVMSRGNEKQDIYRCSSDKEKFLKYLKSATKNYGAIIHCYCLMENHYHLLVETPEGNISRIMQFLNGAYTAYFNAKWERAGHLFQGRYKSILIEKDKYLLELSRYIHLNPVKAGIVEKPEHYRWSSYSSFIGNNKAGSFWHKREFIFEVLVSLNPRRGESYQSFVEEKIGEECSGPFSFE